MIKIFKRLETLKLNYFFLLLTVSFKPFPALNVGTFLAEIFIASPVRGFFPARALRAETPKVPKPIN